MVAINVLLRVLSVVASLLLFYLAAFVYENEEAAIQNRIEAWWLRLDEVRGRMISRNAAFVTVIAQQIQRLLDGLFGVKRMSPRSLMSAAALSVASWYLALIVWALMSSEHAVYWIYPAMGAPFRCAACIAVAIWPSIQWLRVDLLVLTAAAAVMPCWDYFTSPLVPTYVHVLFSLVFLLAMACGVALAILSLRITRRWLSRAVNGRFGKRFFGTLVLQVVLTGLIGGAVALIQFKLSNSLEENIWAFVGGLLIIFSVCALGCQVVFMFSLLLALLITALMFFHYAVWPFLCRLLYNLPRHRVLERKKALYSTATALFLVGVTGGYSLTGLRKFILGE